MRGEGWLRGAHEKPGVMGGWGVLFRRRRELPGRRGAKRPDDGTNKVRVREESRDREGADLGPVSVSPAALTDPMAHTQVCCTRTVGKSHRARGAQHRSCCTRRVATGSLVDDGALQHLGHHVLLIHVVVHESVIRKLVPALDVLDEVGAAVVGVPPGHRGAYRTHHRLGVCAVDELAVLHKSFLVEVLLGTVRTRKGVTVWYIPGLKGCIFGGGLHTFHDEILVFGAGCYMGPDFG